MTLLAEYGLIPDVFDAGSYSNSEVAGVHLQALKDVLLNEALVRNLRNGGWSQVFLNRERLWHSRGKELLKALVTQNRLKLSPAKLPNAPKDDLEWCQEALESHQKSALAGIVTTATVASSFATDVVVAVDELANAAWWQSRSPSVRLPRTTLDYKSNLGLVFKCANSIMFIDPYVDPTQQNYSEFVRLFQGWPRRSGAPQIEIHRVCCEGSGRQSSVVGAEEWKRRFESELLQPLRDARMRAEVFIWDDFHDRYLISDLIGIMVPNGFDVARGSRNNRTTWSRLGRAERDDIQREFDPANAEHKLQYRFTLT